MGGNKINKYLTFRANFPAIPDMELMCLAFKRYKVVYEDATAYFIISEQGERFGIGKEDLEDDLYVVITDD